MMHVHMCCAHAVQCAARVISIRYVRVRATFVAHSRKLVKQRESNIIGSLKAEKIDAGR